MLASDYLSHIASRSLLKNYHHHILASRNHPVKKWQTDFLLHSIPIKVGFVPNIKKQESPGAVQMSASPQYLTSGNHTRS